MKLVSNVKPLIADDSFESHDFTIEAEDASHIISMLSDKLYSDKVLAVVREYMANGSDACKEAGTSRPIEVTVPNALNPVFGVRDYGLGLSKEDVLNVFIKMGKSTKRNTNDQIGAFGIGGKSFRAYGDALNIISYHGGTKTVYTAQKTESGGNRLFVIGQEPSSEPNGIDVSLPVNPKDISEFETKILNLCKFFDTLPILKGTTKKIPAVEKKVCGNGWFQYEDESWANKGYILMGNIPYPIDRNQLDQEERAFLNQVNLCFQGAIGQIDIAPDREKLEYTGRTKRFVKSSITRAKAEFIQKFKDSVGRTASYVDALKMVNNRSKALVPSEDIKDLKWRGEKLILSVKMYKNEKAHDGRTQVKPVFDGCELSSFRVYNDRASFDGTSSWNFGARPVIFVKDKASYSVQRIKSYCEHNSLREAYVISGEEHEIKKFLNAIRSHLLKDKIVWVSSIDYDKTKKQGRSSSHIKVFVFSPKKYENARRQWDVATGISPTETKFYVPICRFNWTKGDYQYLKKCLAFFNDFLKEKINIYGIRTADVKNLDSTWVEFTASKFEERFKKWLGSLGSEFYESLCSIETIFNLKETKRAFQGRNSTPEVKLFLEKTKRVFDLQRKYEKERKCFFYLEGITKTIVKQESTNPIEKKIAEQYPMLKLMIDRRYWFEDEEMKRYIILENIAKGIDKPSVLG